MKNNKILGLAIVGVAAFFGYNYFVKSKQRFYRLPDGSTVPVAQAAQILPGLGYRLTQYGWIHESALQALQNNTSGQSGNSLESFAASLPQLFETGQQLLSAIQSLFPNDDPDQYILGEFTGDVDGIA